MPPTCQSYVFDGIDKELCTLHVPSGTTDLYKAADEWKDFYNITDDAVDGIAAPTSSANPSEQNRNNLNGQRIQGTQRGVNIIRMSDGTTRKVLVR